MNQIIATEYIRQRMQELGYGDNYRLRLRHFVLPAAATVRIDIAEQLLVLLECVAFTRINSDSGYFDLATEQANELQYEHRGTVTMQNLSAVPAHLQFLQAIPYT
ncbi:MAG TPA: hypothetical protein VM802_10200 [Chitinophaga sp.]|uniref:hypothetical protein n=1 Tax=Chitinophaga sp. TaxID=1869181 RepID=UPI002BB4D871|nr:hypothetical protein [Chitinophaga sp.]HVI45234.1 hypothetical protein [Chitinophaga sp.]